MNREPNHESQAGDGLRLPSQGRSEHAIWNNDERLTAEILRPLSSLRKDAMCLAVGDDIGMLALRGAAIAGRWTVLDPSIATVNMADELRLVIGDVESLPFADNTFDYICERSMLQYDSPDHILEEARRILHQDGMYVIAEKVLGDYEGAAAEWYHKVEAIRNPLTKATVTTASLMPKLRAAGFDLQAALELRRTYVQGLSQWLSPSGTVSRQSRSELERLLKERPLEVSNLGLSVGAGKITLPLSWAVFYARILSPRPKPSLVVSLIPVRMAGDHLMIYVQERRAPVISEPEYIGRLEFPQGHVEDGETLEQAARRELAEESGLSIRRVLGSVDFSEVQQPSEALVVESATPSQVVITRGRLNFLALAYIVEVTEWSGDVPGATDNRGRWIMEEEFESIAKYEDILYPLNTPMFKLAVSRLAAIRGVLLEEHYASE